MDQFKKSLAGQYTAGDFCYNKNYIVCIWGSHGRWRERWM